MMTSLVDALREVEKVVQLGDIKHGVDAWRNKAAIITPHLMAAHRHIDKRLLGQERERESGMHHMAHVAARALIALQLEIDRERQKDAPSGTDLVRPCLYKRTGMTPCFVTDGESALDDVGVCVGCGRKPK